MNVVIVNDAAYVRGGADRVALDSACALAANGQRVALFTGFGPQAPQLQANAALSVHCSHSAWIRNGQSSPAAAFNGLWNRAAARALRGVLAGFRPIDTIVHVHLYSSALSASVLDAAMRAGFATLLTLHDYFITCPNGAYFDFPTAKLCERRALSWSCVASHCDSRSALHKPWRLTRTWLQNRVAQIPRRLSAYIAVSENCANLSRRDLPQDSRVELIYNPLAVAQRRPVDVARNTTYLFSGRLEGYKGPQLLAQAAARLGVPAVFCGSGPLEQELRRLNPNARFKGWLQSDALMAELNHARALVFPSLWRETFGLAAAEALARGVPVIAPRGTAAEEFVHHQHNGLLFERNSLDDLTLQLAALADDAAVGRLGAEAYRSYWRAPLTLEVHISRLTALYDSILRGRH